MPASSIPPRRQGSTAMWVRPTTARPRLLGIASFTIIAAMELGRYGVTVNAIAPAALTRMTENLGGGFTEEKKPDVFDAFDPANIAPIVVVALQPWNPSRHHRARLQRPRRPPQRGRRLGRRAGRRQG